MPRLPRLRIEPLLVRGTELERLRAVETIVVWSRWAVAVLAIIFSALDPVRLLWFDWLPAALLVGTNLVATIVVRRPRSASTLQTLGLFGVASDLAIVTLFMFGDVQALERGIYLAGILVIMEAAVRWVLPGAVVTAAAMSASLASWMAYRAARFDVKFEASTLMYRVVVLMAIGMIVGFLVALLERARRQIAERLRESEFVNRFALEAPRIPLDETGWLLAGMLHDDLGFERVGVLFHESSSNRLHPAANAGFDVAIAEITRAISPEMGFSVDEQAGIVSRCFTSGRSRIVPDVAKDPDYIGIDESVRSELCVLLRAGGRRLGVLVVSSTHLNAFDERDARLLEAVAGELAQIIENARLVDMQRETITELESLSALKDDFIAITSHELRTPLTSLRGFARALEDRWREMTDEQQDEAARIISRQVDRLGSLVEDLLTASLLDSGRHNPSLQSVDLDEVVAEVVAEMESAHTDRELQVEIDPGLAPIDADRSFVRRILVNLIDNAIRYSPEGEPVAVRVQAVDDMVRVEVADHGVGIDESDIPLLFNRFIRIRAQPGSHGTGLGLYIVRGLVKSMGGTVTVTSRGGEGSCFAFTVPLASDARGREGRSAANVARQD